VPDWFIFLYIHPYVITENDGIFPTIGKKGYMYSRIETGDPNLVFSNWGVAYHNLAKYTYGLYPDGYTRQMDYEYSGKRKEKSENNNIIYSEEEIGTSIRTFEYISAK